MIFFVHKNWPSDLVFGCKTMKSMMNLIELETNLVDKLEKN